MKPRATAVATTADSSLDQLCINTIRFLAADAVEKAKSGHPGMPMGMADAGYLLWTRFLRWQPQDPEWPGRDRFVLSAGHGSMLLYALLHLSGYDLPMEEIQRFRQLGSRTPGHPEHGLTSGRASATGSASRWRRRCWPRASTAATSRRSASACSASSATAT